MGLNRPIEVRLFRAQAAHNVLQHSLGLDPSMLGRGPCLPAMACEAWRCVLQYFGRGIARRVSKRSILTLMP